MPANLDLLLQSPLLLAGALGAGLLIGVLLQALISSSQRRNLAAIAQRNQQLIAQQQTEINFLSGLSDEQKTQIKLLSSKLEQKSHQVVQLHTQQQERDRAHHQQLVLVEEHERRTREEFEHLAQKIFTANGEQFSKNQEQSVKLLLEPFQQQLGRFSQQVEQFQHSQVSSNASLNTELQHLKVLNQAITQEAHNLTLALKGDKKLTGTWGEVQLERCLQAAGLQTPLHYLREVSFSQPSGQLSRPDFIINLPDNKHIVIDSKMSLVAFDAAMAAETAEQQFNALTEHVKALRKHIDSLAHKDYSALAGVNSPHFVLMFVAVEPAFIEALKHDHTLYDYAVQKNIILVSTTTLMPVLKTISNLWLLDRSHSQAIALAERAGDIHQQVFVIADRLLKLGRTLQTAGNYYNDTVTALGGKQGLYGKVARFGELVKGAKAPLELDEIHSDLELHKLDALMAEAALNEAEN
jgi:DNA recombination protein RmuC